MRRTPFILSVIAMLLSCKAGEKGDTTAKGGGENLTSLASVGASSYIPDNEKKGWKYRPYLVVDRDPSTAWGENEFGPGVGEWICFSFPDPVVVTRIGMIPGYDKIINDEAGDRFYRNLRVKEVKVYFSDGTYEIASFKDERAMQYYDFKKPHETSKLKIYISKVYSEGAKNQNTHISEIEIWGHKK